MNRTELAAVWPPTVTVAAAAGHEPVRPLEAIRHKCLDCSSGHVKDVRNCELVACPLWPFRAGRHPYKKIPSKSGVVPQRAAGGTWIASEPSLEKSPANDGVFSESGHSGATPSDTEG